jgi:hypothetical protein
LLSNYEDVVRYSTDAIGRAIGIRFDLDNLEAQEREFELFDNQDIEENEDPNEDIVQSREEMIRDGWQTKELQISGLATLSQEVRAIIENVDQPSGRFHRDGTSIPATDFIGMDKKMEPNQVFTGLQEALKNINTSKEMMPELKKQGKNKPWVREIVRLLEEKPGLQSKFYAALRRDQTPFWITTIKANKQGLYEVTQMPLNLGEDATIYRDKIRDNIAGNNVLGGERSIYKNNKIDRGGIEKSIKLRTEIIRARNAAIRQDFKGRSEFLKSNKQKIMKLLQAIGIDVTENEVTALFSDILDKEHEGSHYNINILIESTGKILDTIEKGLQNGSIEDVNDIYNSNRGNYGNLVKLMTSTFERLVERSISEGGKSYYSNLNPSFISKLMKKLKNQNKSKRDLAEFIEKEFKQYIGTIYDPVNDRFYIS